MFDATTFQGMVRTMVVDAVGLTRTQAVAAMVDTAITARDRVLGGSPTPSGYRQVVDGTEGAALTMVKPNGVIIFSWQYVGEVFDGIYAWAVAHSPVKSGRYRADIKVFADGAEVAPHEVPPDTKEVFIVFTAHYARRLEVAVREDGRPFAVQYPLHNVESMVTQARSMYGDLASITFTYYDIDDPWIYRRRLSAHRRNQRGGFERNPRRRGGRIEDYVRYPAILIEPKQA